MLRCVGINDFSLHYLGPFDMKIELNGGGGLGFHLICLPLADIG